MSALVSSTVRLNTFLHPGGCNKIARLKSFNINTTYSKLYHSFGLIPSHILTDNCHRHDNRVGKLKINITCKFSMSTSTNRRKLSQTVQDQRDKFLSMELETKRTHYRCGNKFVTFADVLDWRQYFTKYKVQKASALGTTTGPPAAGGSAFSLWLLTGDADVTLNWNVGEKSEPKEALNSKVSLWQGDITALEIDAIVNAANSSLLGGGGVDGAIHRAAGSKLLDECRELKGCPAGCAEITGGYKLPAKHVIHTVGPQGEIPKVLHSCYDNSLQLMIENDLKSIAFPCIATGIYGYPRVQAAHVALSTVRKFLESNSEKVDRIIFTVFLEEDKQVYEELLQKYFPLQQIE